MQILACNLASFKWVHVLECTGKKASIGAVHEYIKQGVILSKQG